MSAIAQRATAAVAAKSPGEIRRRIPLSSGTIPWGSPSRTA
ncbi:hypothetical protein ACWDSF_21715 [Nocardia beijingensis]